MDKKLNNFYKNITPYVVITLSSMLLSSCFGNIPKDIFDLSEKNFTTSDKTAVKYNTKLIISEPITIKILNSEGIIIRYSPIEMRYLIDSQWSDRLPRMIQSKLISSFENNGKILNIAKANQGISSDYQLSSTIRAFEIDINKNKAVISMSIKLISIHTGDIVAKKIFYVEEPFTKDNKINFVQSLDRAFTRISTEIIEWTLSSIYSNQ